MSNFPSAKDDEFGSKDDIIEEDVEESADAFSFPAIKKVDANVKSGLVSEDEEFVEYEDFDEESYIDVNADLEGLEDEETESFFEPTVDVNESDEELDEVVEESPNEILMEESYSAIESNREVITGSVGREFPAGYEEELETLDEVSEVLEDSAEEILDVPVVIPEKVKEKSASTPPVKLPQLPMTMRDKVESLMDVGDWEDESAPEMGPQAEGEVEDDVRPVNYRGLSLRERDFIMIKFLARYRFAYGYQLARLVDSTPHSVENRLLKLEKKGLVRKEVITKGQRVWVSRKAGNLLVDMPFGEIKKGQVSFISIAHTVGLVNLAVELEREAGGKNILGEPDFPAPRRWKFGLRDHPEGVNLGEMTVSEREIRQGQLRWRGSKTTMEMRKVVEDAINNPDAPELEEGNEGLFVVYGRGGSEGEHIPDLVVMRDRDSNGKPMHIAIELELNPKTNPEWRRILKWYTANGVMYDKIYYFTHKPSIAKSILRIAEEVGLQDKIVVRKYIPNNPSTPFWG